MSVTHHTKDEIAHKVREYLKREMPDFNVHMDIDVLQDGIRLEDEIVWYVPIQPSCQPKKTSDYFELIAEVETLLLENDDISVTLIPTLPEEMLKEDS